MTVKDNHLNPLYSFYLLYINDVRACYSNLNIMDSAAVFQTAEFVFAGYMLSQFLSQR